MEQGRFETAPEKRAGIYQQINAIINRDAPFINMWQTNRLQPMRDSVKGYVWPVSGFVDFSKVYLEETKKTE